MKTLAVLTFVVLTGIFVSFLLGQKQEVENPLVKAEVISHERFVDTEKRHTPLDSIGQTQNIEPASETTKPNLDAVLFDKYRTAQVQSAVYEFMLKNEIAKKYHINDFTCHDSYCRIKAVTREEHNLASVSDFLAMINEDEGIVGKDKTNRVALVSVQPSDGLVSYEMELGDAHRYALSAELDEATKILKESYRFERALKK